MSIHKEVERRFPKETEEHAAHVQLDNGLFRHIECRRPGTYSYGFNITTWPGYLAITGDMGSFVFCRLADMFEFFRSDSRRINAGYWREKLVASDRMGALVFDPDKFRAAIVDRYRQWKDSYGDDYDAEQRRELRERVRDEVLSRADDGEHAALMAAYEFDHDRKQFFPDFGETNCNEYTYQFLWCCHAIVWAIAQYDAAKAVEVPAHA